MDAIFSDEFFKDLDKELKQVTADDGTLVRQIAAPKYTATKSAQRHTYWYGFPRGGVAVWDEEWMADNLPTVNEYTGSETVTLWSYGNAPIVSRNEILAMQEAVSMGRTPTFDIEKFRVDGGMYFIRGFEKSLFFLGHPQYNPTGLLNFKGKTTNPKTGESKSISINTGKVSTVNVDGKDYTDWEAKLSLPDGWRYVWADLTVGRRKIRSFVDDQGNSYFDPSKLLLLPPGYTELLDIPVRELGMSFLDWIQKRFKAILELPYLSRTMKEKGGFDKDAFFIADNAEKVFKHLIGHEVMRDTPQKTDKGGYRIPIIQKTGGCLMYLPQGCYRGDGIG